MLPLGGVQRVARLDIFPSLWFSLIMDVLIVEDELRVARYLTSSLNAEGHHTRLCTTVDEAESQMAAHDFQPEAVILDRMLQGKDGATLISRLRHRYPKGKIVVLSAIGLAEEKAAVLDMGADDYLTKPFSLAELSARLRAVSRRNGPGAASSILQSGNLTVDLKSQTVASQNRRLDLSRKEFQILVLFMQSPGRVYTKYQLLDSVWDLSCDVESNTVEVTIKNLRRKLEAFESGIEICNRRHVGYWLET